MSVEYWQISGKGQSEGSPYVINKIERVGVMHTLNFPNSRFHFNADLSGEVEVIGFENRIIDMETGKESHCTVRVKVPAEELVAFVDTARERMKNAR